MALISTFQTNLPSFTNVNHVVPVTVPSGLSNSVLVIMKTVQSSLPWNSFTEMQVNGSTTGVVASTGSTVTGIQRSIRVWYILNPTAGSYNVTGVWNTTSQNGGLMTVALYDAVDQTTPFTIDYLSAGGIGTPAIKTFAAASPGPVFVAGRALGATTVTPVGSLIGTAQPEEAAWTLPAASLGMEMAYAAPTIPTQVSMVAVLINPASGGGTAPTGTVTISNVTVGTVTATATYSYSAADQTGFEASLDGGTAFSIGASPAGLSGLTQNTAYSLRIRAVNASGQGAWSTAYPFTTAEAQLPAPAGLSLDYYTQSTFKVNFTDVPGAASYVVSTNGQSTWTALASTKIVSSAIPANLASVSVAALSSTGMRGVPAILPVGVAASTVPATGRDGPGIIWDWKDQNSIPGATLVHPRVTVWPSTGTLTVYADSHFLFTDSVNSSQDVTIVPYTAGNAQTSYKVRFTLQ